MSLKRVIVFLLITLFTGASVSTQDVRRPHSAAAKKTAKGTQATKTIKQHALSGLYVKEGIKRVNVKKVATRVMSIDKALVFRTLKQHGHVRNFEPTDLQSLKVGVEDAVYPVELVDELPASEQASVACSVISYDAPISVDDATSLQEIFQTVAPTVLAQLPQRRAEVCRKLIEVLLEDLRPTKLDVLEAQMNANAIAGVLESTQWLTAEEIGRAAGLGERRPDAPAYRWKKQGKIFSITHGKDPERFPRYALDDSFQPLAAMKAVLKAIGPISGWRIGAWFDSPSTRLDGGKPKDLIATEPRAVITAAERYHVFAEG